MSRDRGAHVHPGGEPSGPGISRVKSARGLVFGRRRCRTPGVVRRVEFSGCVSFLVCGGRFDTATWLGSQSPEAGFRIGMVLGGVLRHEGQVVPIGLFLSIVSCV